MKKKEFAVVVVQKSKMTIAKSWPVNSYVKIAGRNKPQPVSATVNVSGARIT